MSTNPNTVKSQDDLPTTNDGKRSSNVLLSTVEKCERLQKQLDIAVKVLNTFDCTKLVFKDYDGTVLTFKGTFEGKNIIGKALDDIEELNK